MGTLNLAAPLLLFDKSRLWAGTSKCSVRIRFWNEAVNIFLHNFRTCIIILSMNFTINKLFWPSDYGQNNLCILKSILKINIPCVPHKAGPAGNMRAPSGVFHTTDSFIATSSHAQLSCLSEWVKTWLVAPSKCQWINYNNIGNRIRACYLPAQSYMWHTVHVLKLTLKHFSRWMF